jgi:hypothetical protein
MYVVFGTVAFADLSRSQQANAERLLADAEQYIAQHQERVGHSHDRLKLDAAPVVYVGRPSEWGNPFPLNPQTTRRACLLDYISNLLYGDQRYMLEHVRALDGKVLECWCRRRGQWQPGQLCHADVLAYLSAGVELF